MDLQNISFIKFIKEYSYLYLVNIKVGISFLQSFGRVVHGVEDCRVGVGSLQSLSLHLDCRQSPVNLLELLVVPGDNKISF